MTVAVRIAVTAPDLSHWREAMDPVELNEEIGKEYASHLKSYFELKNRTPNAKGFPRKYFWQSVADSTEYESADATGATVKVSDGRFALRYFGGVVTPKRGKYLAIPLTREAAEATANDGRARNIPDLFLIKGRNGNKFLARKTPAGLERIFLLKTSTTHKPDATALPPPDDTAKALSAHAETFLRLKLQS